MAVILCGFTLLATIGRAQSTDVIFESSAASMSGEATARDLNTFDFPGKKHPAKSSGKTPATNKRNSLVYTSTAALRQQTITHYTQKINGTNPALAKAVTQAFGPGKTDYSTIYQNIAGGFGLKANDAGDAVVANLILGYVIVNNLQGSRPVTNAQVKGVQAQFKPSLAGNPKLSAPAVVAQTGEEMKLQFVIQQAGWQSAIKRNTLPAFRESVYQAMKANYGIDMRKVRLGNNGFEKI